MADEHGGIHHEWVLLLREFRPASLGEIIAIYDALVERQIARATLGEPRARHRVSPTLIRILEDATSLDPIDHVLGRIIPDGFDYFPANKGATKGETIALYEIAHLPLIEIASTLPAIDHRLGWNRLGEIEASDNGVFARHHILVDATEGVLRDDIVALDEEEPFVIALYHSLGDEVLGIRKLVVEGHIGAHELPYIRLRPICRDYLGKARRDPFHAYQTRTGGSYEDSLDHKPLLVLVYAILGASAVFLFSHSDLINDFKGELDSTNALVRDLEDEVFRVFLGGSLDNHLSHLHHILASQGLVRIETDF
jgi:hypothetical protein